MSNFTNLQKFLEYLDNTSDKNHSVSKSRVLHIRVSFQELKEIKQNAKLLDVTASEYIRALALIPPVLLSEHIDNKQQHFIIFDFKTLEKILTLINKICNDYNQILKAYNTIKSWEWAHENEIREQFVLINTHIQKIEEDMFDLSESINEIMKFPTMLIRPRQYR